MRTKTRLLVIDDEPVLLEMVKNILTDDHEVVSYVSATEAFERLRSDQDFDLILCDLIMADMSGMAFYERLKELDVELMKRVVFVTGGAFTEPFVRFLDGVSNYCIKKPFGAERLKKTVNELLVQHNERLQLLGQW